MADINIRKRWLLLVLIVFVCFLTGCEKTNPYGLSIKNPVTITIWHYYKGPQKKKFDNLVKEFNRKEGRQKGIFIKALNKGSIYDISCLVNDTMEKEIGSEPLPDMITAYVDGTYELDQKGLAADLSPYLTQEERAEYVAAYIEEGEIDKKGEIKLFPIAKSTEILTVNKTEWDKFAKAAGVTEASLSTWEGITAVAESYYKWTDSLTAVPNDGKAFFGRDAFANYILIGSVQLGHELFCMKNGKIQLDFDQKVIRKLWDNYYIPYVNGYFGSYGRFRSDDVKTGRLVAYVGSTSGIVYLPTSVTLEDGTQYPIESKQYPLPNFKETAPVAVQQGAGIMVFHSNQRREYASVVFLKWFTEIENNMEFVVDSGYLPVKQEAEKEQVFMPFLIKTGKNSYVSKNFILGLDIIKSYQLYTSKPFLGGDCARAVLETSMVLKAREDYEKVQALMKKGISREQAVEKIVTDEKFDIWYKVTKEQLEAIIEE